MAEQFPSFDCGFEFLNDMVNTNVEGESDKAATAGKKRFVEVTETQKNQLLLETQAKATKSSTNWGVKAFKGKEIQ